MRQDIAIDEIGRKALAGTIGHPSTQPAHHALGEEIEDDVIQTLCLLEQLGDADAAVVEESRRRTDFDGLAHAPHKARLIAVRATRRASRDTWQSVDPKAWNAPGHTWSSTLTPARVRRRA